MRMGGIAVRNWVGKLYAERITLTAPGASNAARVIFMVTGADKAPALKAVLEGPLSRNNCPRNCSSRKTENCFGWRTLPPAACFRLELENSWAVLRSRLVLAAWQSHLNRPLGGRT